MKYCPVSFLENLNLSYYFSASQKHSRICFVYIFLLVSNHFLAPLLASPLCLWVHLSLGEKPAVITKSGTSKGRVKWTGKLELWKKDLVQLNQSSSAWVRD